MSSRKHHSLRLTTELISNGLRLVPTVQGTRTLMYHAISNQAVEDASGLYSLGPREFREHVDALSQWSSTGRFIPVSFGIYHPKGLHITFDDGYADSFDAALALAERGFFITIFVATSLLNSGTSFLTEQQVRQLASHQHLEIRSCGLLRLPLTEPSDSSHTTELLHLQSSLSRFCRSEMVLLSYPFERHNRRVRDAARRSGFRRAASSRRGFHRVTNESFRIPRLDIRSGDSLHILETRLSGSWNLLGWAGQ
jgi:peptidoglycan/xylan/chitin deacetylase (PgdA/CDA1 family)